MAREIKLAGMNFTKIAGERKPNFQEKYSMKPSINIKSIEEHKAGKADACKIEFAFGIDYSGLGKIDLEGVMFLLMDSKTLKEAVKGWKDKKMNDEINLIILNAIMQKASLKALQVEEDLGLPPHVSLPRLQVGESKK